MLNLLIGELEAFGDWIAWYSWQSVQTAACSSPAAIALPCTLSR
jgi:hypothetical protein